MPRGSDANAAAQAATQGGGNTPSSSAKGITKVSKADLATKSGNIKKSVTEQVSDKSSGSSKSGSAQTSGSSNGHRNSVDTDTSSNSSVHNLSVESAPKTAMGVAYQWKQARDAAALDIDRNRTMALVNRGPSNEEGGRGSSETTNPSIKPDEASPRPQDLAYTGMPTDATKAFQQGLPRTEPQKGPAYKPQVGNDSQVLTGKDNPDFPAQSRTTRQQFKQYHMALKRQQANQPSAESRTTVVGGGNYGIKTTGRDIQQEASAKAEHTDTNKRVYKVEKLARQNSAIAPQVKSAQKLNRAIGLGYKIYATINTDSHLGLNDCRVGADLLVAQFFANPDGSFAQYFLEECEKLAEEDENFSYDYHQLISDRAYCKAIMHEVWHGQPIAWTKHPGTTEASYRCMNLYISMTGQAVYIHPLAAGLANDDADGDASEVEFERPKAEMLGRPTDYILNPISRRFNLNWDIWNRTNWGDNADDARARLESIFEHAGIGINSKNKNDLLDRLGLCLFEVSSKQASNTPNIDRAMELLLTTLAHMANDHVFIHTSDQMPYENRSEALSDVISAIWLHNTTLNNDTVKLYPSFEKEMARFMSPPEPIAIENSMRTVHRKATVPDNYRDMATDLFLGLGSGGETNLPWRQAAATVLQSRRKEDKRASELIPNIKYEHVSAFTAQYYYSLAANLLLAEDDAAITYKSYIGAHVFHEMGRPPIGLTETELNDLIEEYYGELGRTKGPRPTRESLINDPQSPVRIAAQKMFENQWEPWCIKFAEVYNYWVTVLNEANWIADTEGKYHQVDDYKSKLIPDPEEILSETQPTRSQLPRGRDYSRFINAFRDVYGPMPMHALFDTDQVEIMLSQNLYDGGFSVLPNNWKNMTLLEFIRNSDFISGEEDSHRSSYEYFFHRLMNSRKYLADNLYKSLHEFFDKFAQREQLNWKDGFDFLLELSPKVCFSLGITAINARDNKMVAAMFDKEHKTADAKQSVYYSILTAYKMQEVFRAEIAEDPDRAFRELQKLSDCSNLWHALVNDYMNGGDAIGILLDTDVSLEEKETLCARIVREQHIQYTFQTNETAYQLIDDNRGPFGVTSFPGDAKELQQAAERLVNKWERSDADMLNQVHDLQNYVKQHPGSFMKTLSELLSGKRTLAWISSAHSADVIGEAINPTDDQKDKSHNQPATSDMYAAVANNDYGGMFPDWLIINGLFQGTITKETLQKNPGLIARLIYDPDFKLTVVDGTKQTEVTWRTLFYLSKYNQTRYRTAWDPDSPNAYNLDYNASEDGWMHLFEEYPQIAMTLRQTTVLPRTNESTGISEPAKSRLAAYGTVRDAVEYSNPTNTLITHLSRYPGFTAMASLSADITGKTVQQTRDNMIQGVNTLAETVRYLATVCKKTGWSPEQAASTYFGDIEEILAKEYGHKKVMLYHVSDQTADPDDVRAYVQDVPGETSSKLIGDMTRFIEDALQYDLGYSDFEYDHREVPELDFNYESHSNISLYYGVYSALSSAKIGYSIPINGKAEELYRALGILANRRTSEDCGNHEVRDVTIWELLDGSYDGSLLEDGTIVDSSAAEDLFLKYGMFTAIRVESPEFCTEPLGCCEHHHPKTLSDLNRRNAGATPLGRLLEWIRDDSTEGHGLQLKKSGLNFLIDSTPRDALSSKRAIEFRNTVQGAFDSEGLPGAYRAAGQLLMSFYSELNYTEFTLNDWIDIAHYIVHQNSSGNCVIITLLQLGDIANQAIAKLKFEQGTNVSIDQKYQAIVNDLNDAINSYTVVDPNTVEIDEEHQLDPEDIFSNISVNGATRTGWTGVTNFANSRERNAETLRKFLEGNPDSLLFNQPFSFAPRLDYKIQQYKQELGDEFSPRTELDPKLKKAYIRDLERNEDDTGWVEGTSQSLTTQNDRVNYNRFDTMFYTRTGRFAQLVDETEDLRGIVSMMDDTDVDDVFGEYINIHNVPRIVIAPKPGSRNVVVFDTLLLYDNLSTADFRQVLKDTANVCRDMGMTLRIPLEPPTIGRTRHLIDEEKKHLAECKEEVLKVLDGLGDWGSNVAVYKPSGAQILKAGKPAQSGRSEQPDITSLEWLNLDFFEVEMNHPQKLKGDPEEFIAGTYTLSDEDTDILAVLPNNTILGRGDSDIVIPEQGANHIGSIPKEGSISFRPESMFVACRPQFGTFETTTIDTTVNDTDEIQEILRLWKESSNDIAFDTTMKPDELSMRMAQFDNKFQRNLFDNELGLISKDVAQGDIIGFAKCYQDGYVVYHPLQFETDMSGKQKTSLPMHCEIRRASTNSLGYLTIDWYSEESLDGQAIKLQQGDYPVNKSTGVVDRSVQAHVASGHDVHFIGAAFNFIDRANAENFYQDMSSFIGLARSYNNGYNAALDIEGFMPDEKDAAYKRGIASGTLSRGDWRFLLDRNTNWFGEDEAELNAWLTQTCKRLMKRGINPTDFLASNFGDELNRTRSFNWYDWSYGFSDFQSLESYMDNLLRFFHKIDNTYCPDGRNDESSPDNYLFDINFMVRIFITVDNETVAPRGHLRVGPHIITNYSGNTSGATNSQHDTDVLRAWVALATRNATGEEANKLADIISDATASNYRVASATVAPVINIGGE